MEREGIDPEVIAEDASETIASEPVAETPPQSPQETPQAAPTPQTPDPSQTSEPVTKTALDVPSWEPGMQPPPGYKVAPDGLSLKPKRGRGAPGAKRNVQAKEAIKASGTPVAELPDRVTLYARQRAAMARNRVTMKPVGQAAASLLGLAVHSRTGVDLSLIPSQGMRCTTAGETEEFKAPAIEVYATAVAEGMAYLVPADEVVPPWTIPLSSMLGCTLSVVMLLAHERGKQRNVGVRDESAKAPG